MGPSHHDTQLNKETGAPPQLQAALAFCLMRRGRAEDHMIRRGSSLRSRRGSSSVFLCVILSALISICFAFIYSTMEYTTASRADAMMQIAGDSLLSEFDLDVAQEYGLFLLRDSNKDLSSKLRGYLMYTFGSEKSVQVTGVKASGSPFTLTDPVVAEEQILTYMREGGLEIIKDKQSGPAIKTHAKGHSLRHGPTIASLPSRQMPDTNLANRVAKLADSVKTDRDVENLLSKASDRGLLQCYVIGKFNSSANAVNKDHFFYREVEYILHGKLTDRSNGSLTYALLMAFRLPLNGVAYLKDRAKVKAVSTVASAFPPPADAILAVALPIAWIAAETVNDVELLMEGGKVPIIKKKKNWALDLQSILNQLEKQGTDTSGEKYREKYALTDGEMTDEEKQNRDDQMRKEAEEEFSEEKMENVKLSYVVHPREEKGLNYSSYLRIFLAMEDMDLMTARILDLIQINMRKNVDGNFLIGECCTGVAYQAAVNKRDYSYEKIYQRILYR